MAAPIKPHKYTQDIRKPVLPRQGGGLMFTGDANADTIIVRLYDGNDEYPVSGSVTMRCIRADGVTEGVEGSVSGNTVQATLKQACCAVPGPLMVTLSVTADGVTSTILKVVYTVDATETGVIGDPGTIIPDVAALIAAIEEAVATIPPDYSALSEDVNDLRSATEPLFDVKELLTNKMPTGGNNTAVTYNNDGSTTIGTTDYGNTLFGVLLTLTPGDYYLFGVPNGIAFLTPSTSGSDAYTNRVFENTSSEPKLYHTDVSVDLAVGFRSPSAPSESYTIYPSLFQLVPKVDRALLEKISIPTGTDLNTIVEPGYYLLNSAATYVHAPDISSGILTVTCVGNIVNQTVNQFGTSARTFTPNLCIRNGTKEGVAAEWKYIGRKYGIRAAMIGDSITWGRNGNVNDPSDPGFRTEYQIPDAIAHNLGIVCENKGVGSMGWIKEGDGNVKAYDVLSGLTLSDYDAIFFCLGVNDGFSPLGTWDSEDETTIMGQFNKCIKYIMTNRPSIRVIVIAPFNGRNIGTFPDYWYGPRDNPQGYVSRRVLSDTLKQACEYYWIPYIEQYDGPINPYSINTLIGADGVHPTNTGFIALGQWLSSKIGAVL